jgi:hypothetical protein
MQVKLTDRFVKSATTGDRHSPIFMDDGVIRFVGQVRETDRKTFTLDHAFEGRRRRLFTGNFSRIGRPSRRARQTDQARDQLTPI